MRKKKEKGILASRHYIVTGGTQGLGRGIALHLAAEGAAGLTICGRNREYGQAAAREISQSGCACEYVPADLFHEKDCRNVVELWDLLLNVNARAPFILMQEVVRFMKARKISGSIVNIISDCARGG
ncbi:MAG: SDR family NAD(P)-dependent oxidoreductase [Spirochaetaceae bacterium]|nr:MAG: SDR family NAD(P)-dependent oxidoreductase [Spirochaetaceae bacterium]